MMRALFSDIEQAALVLGECGSMTSYRYSDDVLSYLMRTNE